MKLYIRILLLSLALLMGVSLPAEAAEAAKKAVYTVVIDAGHGGKDAGAVDNGVKEKDINLGVALKLGELIKKRMKDVRVVYTRDDDTFVSLQNRADKANKEKADLFISIHTNSVAESNPNRRTVAGASTYALGLHKDQANMEVARRENAVIELEKGFEEKYSGFDPNSDESYIIFEMVQKKKLGQSLKFAKDVQQEMVNTASRSDRGVHQAGFWVLWATSAPAVLLELDFICNPNSAKYIASGTGQSKLAESIYKAVDRYFHSSSVKAEPVEEKVENEDAVAVRSSHKSGRTDVAPAAPEASSQKSTQRRRRSASSKKASDERQVAVSSIPVASEEAVAHARKEQEEKKEKEEKAAVEKTKKDDKKVKKQKEQKEKKKSKSYARTERMITVYKVQLLVSTDELKPNHAAFAGLSPVFMFKDRGLYHYTYGESPNKQEMEKLLQEVRKKIPDAILIKSSKSVKTQESNEN